MQALAACEASAQKESLAAVIPEQESPCSLLLKTYEVFSMDDVMEIKFKVIELAYKYDKPIPDVLQDLMRIKIDREQTEKPGKKAKKGKGS